MFVSSTGATNKIERFLPELELPSLLNLKPKSIQTGYKDARISCRNTMLFTKVAVIDQSLNLFNRLLGESNSLDAKNTKIEHS